jgi:hypothetical protein
MVSIFGTCLETIADKHVFLQIIFFEDTVNVCKGQLMNHNVFNLIALLNNRK